MAMENRARFDLCADCHRHGRIVLADGTTLPENDTKEQAWGLLSWACQENGGLPSEDVEAIGDGIEVSGLPETNLEALPRRATRIMVVFWNMNRAIGVLRPGVADPACFHQLFLSNN